MSPYLGSIPDGRTATDSRHPPPTRFQQRVSAQMGLNGRSFPSSPPMSCQCRQGWGTPLSAIGPSLRGHSMLFIAPARQSPFARTENWALGCKGKLQAASAVLWPQFGDITSFPPERDPIQASQRIRKYSSPPKPFLNSASRKESSDHSSNGGGAPAGSGMSNGPASRSSGLDPGCGSGSGAISRSSPGSFARNSSSKRR